MTSDDRLLVREDEINVTRGLSSDQAARLAAHLDASVGVTAAGGGSMATTETTTTEDEAATGAGWSGVIAQEGVDTGDGRRIEPGALGWRELPLSMMAMHSTAHGGFDPGQAYLAGRIGDIQRHGQDITGTGEFDTGEFGAETERLVREGMLNGISIDLAINEAEVLPDPDIDDPEEAYWMGTLNILDGTILGATVVPFPAFENAQIAIVAGAAMHLSRFRTETIEGERRRVCSYFMPFTAAALADAPPPPPAGDAEEEAEPEDEADDAAEAISDITDAVNGWPGLDGEVVITIDGEATTVPFPAATSDGAEPGEDDDAATATIVALARAVLRNHLRRDAR